MGLLARDLPVVHAIAALADPIRRALFEHVREASAPVTRESAAEAIGISRKLAAFHLDKLVRSGLLAGRAAGSGRGLGRPPKVYEFAGADFRISVPPRSLDLLAELLVEAVRSEEPQERAADSALRVARARGAGLGAEERRARRTGRLGLERALAVVLAVLEPLGFEPVREPGPSVRLRNCPFHPLAERNPELVCGVNHAFVSGVLDGLQVSTAAAALVPTPGQCCVRLQASTTTS